MTIKRRGRRPASYPSPPIAYQAGALDARRFLRHTQRMLYRLREFRPEVLREMLDDILRMEPSPDYRAGFLDALGAYLLLALEGCQPRPTNWNVLADVPRM